MHFILYLLPVTWRSMVWISVANECIHPGKLLKFQTQFWWNLCVYASLSLYICAQMGFLSQMNTVPWIFHVKFSTKKQLTRIHYSWKNSPSFKWNEMNVWFWCACWRFSEESWATVYASHQNWDVIKMNRQGLCVRFWIQACGISLAYFK